MEIPSRHKAKPLAQLPRQQFLEIVANAPLVSIDLVLRSAEGKILMGLRKSQPAQGCWFVPGGRIMKGETLDAAFTRICVKELAMDVVLGCARPLGVFKHFYDTNFAEQPGITTHYVVLAYELELSPDLDQLPTVQHSAFRWIGENEQVGAVHPHARAYFGAPRVMMNDAQYSLMNARRDAFNNLLWQTPVLSLIAQAFLFTVILNEASSKLAIVVSSLLSIATAAASRHLLDKHRDSEERCAICLDKHEQASGWYAANGRGNARTRWLRLSSYRIWKWVLPLFGLAAVVAMVIRLVES